MRCTSNVESKAGAVDNLVFTCNQCKTQMPSLKGFKSSTDKNTKTVEQKSQKLTSLERKFTQLKANMTKQVQEEIQKELKGLQDGRGSCRKG